MAALSKEMDKIENKIGEDSVLKSNEDRCDTVDFAE